MSEEKQNQCGECLHFTNEDMDGVGLCARNDDDGVMCYQLACEEFENNRTMKLSDILDKKEFDKLFRR